MSSDCAPSRDVLDPQIGPQLPGMVETTHPFHGPRGLIMVGRGSDDQAHPGRARALDEQSLVADLRRRRVEALDTLLRVHGGEIQAVAFLTLRNEPDAEEVLTDTLLTAWQKIDTLRDPARLRPWLLTIAARLALRRRRRRRPQVVSLEVAAGPSGVASHAVSDAANEVALRDALNRLPPRMRAAIALHLVADLPIAEVARALGTSENTVKSQLREGRARLREALGERALPDPAPAPETGHG
jgi:RNA polymerase sigma-70 factor, ECF subfamily